MRFASTTWTLVAVIALAAGMTTSTAFAQASRAGRGGDMGEKLKERFAAADKNGDGKLTKDEAKAGMPFVYKHFDEIDKAHTGSVSMMDIAAFAKQMRAAKQPGG
jgi:Ca2+-binding EF-hand superfamily protein